MMLARMMFPLTYKMVWYSFCKCQKDEGDTIIDNCINIAIKNWLPNPNHKVWRATCFPHSSQMQSTIGYVNIENTAR